MSNPIVATTPAQFAQLLAQGQNAVYYPPSGMDANAATASIQNAIQSTAGVTVTGASSTPTNSTAGNPQSSTWDNILDAISSPYSAGGASPASGAAQVAAGAGGSTQAAAAASGTANTGTNNLGANSTASLGSWISSHAGNYGLVVMGALLALGALLISQRDNIEKVAAVAAKVAA